MTDIGDALRAYRRRAVRSFLMARRARLQPEDVGLPVRERRRAPGLNRAEVAQLAGITEWWYERFESQRDDGFGTATVQAVSDALQLDAVERDYLRLLLTGKEPPPRLIGPDPLAAFANAADLVACAVFDAGYRRVRSNRLYDRIFGYAGTQGEQNALVRMFREPERRALWGDAWERVARAMVGRVRYLCALTGSEPDVVAELAGDAEFRRLWDGHAVDLPEMLRDFTLEHPDAGQLALRIFAPRMHPASLFGFYVPADDASAARVSALVARDDASSGGAAYPATSSRIAASAAGAEKYDA